MASAWSKIFRGIADVASGLAEIAEGRSSPAASPPEETPGAISELPRTPEELEAYLSGLAEQMMDAGGEPESADSESAPRGGLNLFPTGEVPSEAGPIPQDPTDPPEDVDAKPPAHLPDSPEVERQLKEKRRRRRLREDPVLALDVAEYWLMHLEQQPLRAEDWVNCIEAIPGTCQERYERAMRLPVDEIRRYATLYDACITALSRGRERALSMEHANLSEDDFDCLLDAERERRILFWLGDRPDVAALTQDISDRVPTGEVPEPSETDDDEADAILGVEPNAPIALQEAQYSSETDG